MDNLKINLKELILVMKKLIKNKDDEFIYSHIEHIIKSSNTALSMMSKKTDE